MPSLVRTLLLLACAMCVAPLAPVARGADAAPVGAWRTTSGCFLVAFMLNENGRAQAAYMTGEEDTNAAWTWDGATLKITSKSFDLDTFTGHVANDRIEADYVWHDLDKDQLNKQLCVFERFNPFGR